MSHKTEKLKFQSQNILVIDKLIRFKSFMYEMVNHHWVIIVTTVFFCSTLNNSHGNVNTITDGNVNTITDVLVEWFTSSLKFFQEVDSCAGWWYYLFNTWLWRRPMFSVYRSFCTSTRVRFEFQKLNIRSLCWKFEERQIYNYP